MSAFVDVEDVTLSYDGTEAATALAGCSFGVRRGEFAAVVGPSGCGKSTLMKLVTGLIRPQRGRVRVDGRLVDAPVKIAGMAFQNPTLLPWRRTLDNVLLPLEIVEPHRSQFRRRRREYEEKALDLLDLVGLADFARKPVWELSGGMQQRAQLCRALIHEPSLLMLDEPFGALDAFTRDEMNLLLQEIWLETKKTVVFITHNIAEAVFLAERIMVMSPRPGRLANIYEVDLPRPRPLEVTTRPHFIELVGRIKASIDHGAGAHAGSIVEMDG